MPTVAGRPLGRRAALLVTVLTFAAGCSHSSSPPRPSPTPNPSAVALAQLRALAARAEQASFTATYHAQGSSPPRTGTITVYRTPSLLRLDVAEAGAPVVRILLTGQGTFSCKIPPNGSAACVTLAEAGAAVPQSLDPGLQHLFTTTFDGLAGNAPIEVTGAPTVRDVAGQQARCFAVQPVTTSISLTPGEYCFTDTAILAQATFRTSSLTLLQLHSAPQPDDFRLPASPVPLSPTATATP